MRILWLNHLDIRDPGAGGAERTIEEVSARLVARGHEVHLVTTRWHDSRKEDQIRGILVHRSFTPLGPHLLAPSFYRGSSRPDIVVNDLAHCVPWLTPVLSDIPGTAFFRHLHQRSLNGQVPGSVAAVLKWVERQYPIIYRDWTFVTESRSSVGDLESLGIPRAHCRRIPPGVDTQRFTPGTASSALTLVYFGGMRRYKRPLDVLYACNELRARGWSFRLNMIGEGPMIGEIKRLTAALGLKEFVTLTGRVTDEQLVAIIRRSHVNVHCSITEGWCLSAMEAAACGVPTVGYRIPGLSESVADGQSGLLVQDGNVKALADAIEVVLRDPLSWRERSRAHAAQFSWDRCASEWESHLSEI